MTKKNSGRGADEREDEGNRKNAISKKFGCDRTTGPDARTIKREKFVCLEPFPKQGRRDRESRHWLRQKRNGRKE